MTSVSPSPPRDTEPTLSHSLSPPTKKKHKHHRHSSHGKPLRAERPQRRKSNTSLPPSPRNTAIKRNRSHVTLPKKAPVALRKNKSATALISTQARKLGPAAPRKTEKRFEFAEMSSSEEEVDDSPVLTTQNSTVSVRDSPALVSPRAQAPPALSSAHAVRDALGVEGASEGGVSHFLPASPRQPSSGSDFDVIIPKKVPRAAPPNRTQRRLELQRHETLSPATPHVRSHASHTLDPAVLKQDYDLAARQLHVVRRFRNPITEALVRAKSSGLITPDRDKKTNTSLSSGRTGRTLTDEYGSVSPDAGKGVRRLGSHDDIGLSRSLGDNEGQDRNGLEGLSAEDEMIRRLWESREVYERDT